MLKIGGTKGCKRGRSPQPQLPPPLQYPQLAALAAAFSLPAAVPLPPSFAHLRFSDCARWMGRLSPLLFHRWYAAAASAAAVNSCS